MTLNAAAVEPAARRSFLRRVIGPGWAVLACVLVAAQAPAGVRAPVVIILLCVIPGMALVGLVNPDSFAIELSLSIALSLAISGLTAGVLVYAHLWSPTAVVVIVASISLAGALRDVRLGPLRERARPFRPLHAGAAPPGTGSLPAVTISFLQLADRTRRRLSAAIAAAPQLAARADLQGVRRMRRPRVTARRLRPERSVVPPSPGSPLQGFLLDELRRRTGSEHRRRSLARLQPDDVADLLSWASLQRFIAQRAIREINPELWFVDDLELRLQRQLPGERGGGTSVPARGAWITGVSAQMSLPVAWRVLKEDEKAKEWRTRLALDMIDSLPEVGLGGAVVASGTAYGSLSGFRRGLQERALPHLVRVDAVTAAREVAPENVIRSAAQARQILQERIADGGAGQGEVDPNGDPREPELVLLKAAECLLLCELQATGRLPVFWLSNLPAETAPRRLTYLMRLASRSRGKSMAPDFVLGAPHADVENGPGLDRELALLALAGGLRRLDPADPLGEGNGEA
jgi:hypothetical protein